MRRCKAGATAQLANAGRADHVACPLLHTPSNSSLLGRLPLLLLTHFTENMETIEAPKKPIFTDEDEARLQNDPDLEISADFILRVGAILNEGYHVSCAVANLS